MPTSSYIFIIPLFTSIPFIFTDPFDFGIIAVSILKVVDLPAPFLFIKKKIFKYFI